MPLTSSSSDHLARRRFQKAAVTILIAAGFLVIVGILGAKWLFPDPYNRILAQFYSWSARVAALMGSSSIAYDASNRAVALAPQNVEYLNKRCWYGAIAGDAQNVIGDCHRVVEMAPNDTWAHDSLGVALVFIKDYQGALIEFQFIVDHSSRKFGPLNPFFQERKDWIVKLQKGENPFDDQTLKALLLQ